MHDKVISIKLPPWIPLDRHQKKITYPVSRIAIALVWLFHVSAVIGIFLGYQDWFLPKTQLNLLACFILLIWAGDLLSAKKAFFAYLFFAAGMLIEWLGVHFGWPFGEYVYGENLGIKMDGVPYMIGINWCMLVLITGSMAERFVKSNWVRPLLGASLMVGLDFFIEPSVHLMDFWYWTNGSIPINNYIGWFVVALILHIVYQRSIPTMNFKFSLHLYLAQLFFFVSFYVYTHI